MDRSIIQFWSQTSTSAGNQGPRGILRLIPVLPQVLLDSANTRKGDQARKRNWLKAWLSSNNTRAFNPSIHRGNLTTGGWLDRSHPCTVYSSCSFLRIVFHSVFPYFFSQEIVDWPARWQEETAKAASEVMGQALLLDEKSSHLVTT